MAIEAGNDKGGSYYGGGGGATDTPGDIGGAGWYFDQKKQTWVFGFPTYEGGRQTGVDPARAPEGSDYDPGYVRQAIDTVANHVYRNPNGGGGSGGGLPAGLVKAVIPAATAAIGRAASRNPSGTGSGDGTLPPELQQLLALAMKRMTAQEPLFQAINAQALGGLPTAYRGGQ